MAASVVMACAVLRGTLPRVFKWACVAKHALLADKRTHFEPESDLIIGETSQNAKVWYGHQVEISAPLLPNMSSFFPIPMLLIMSYLFLSWSSEGYRFYSGWGSATLSARPIRLRSCGILRRFELSSKICYFNLTEKTCSEEYKGRINVCLATLNDESE